MKRRPLRVTIIGVLSILAGLIFLFPALNLFDLDNLIDLAKRSIPNLLFSYRQPSWSPWPTSSLASAASLVGSQSGFYLVIISIVLNFAIALLALLNANMSHWEALLLPWPGSC